jgi:hypothetical protein
VAITEDHVGFALMPRKTPFGATQNIFHAVSAPQRESAIPDNSVAAHLSPLMHSPVEQARESHSKQSAHQGQVNWYLSGHSSHSNCNRRISIQCLVASLTACGPTDIARRLHVNIIGKNRGLLKFSLPKAHCVARQPPNFRCVRGRDHRGSLGLRSKGTRDFLPEIPARRAPVDARCWRIGCAAPFP